MILLELKPSKCNLCNGKVIYTSNARIYGTEYGSGMMYYCTKCKAYVGTHKPRPKEALGLLANKEMRDMKCKCHELFDKKWKNEPTSKKRFKARRNAYRELAKKLNIDLGECHFGYFDLDTLKRVYRLLESEETDNVSDKS